jgi:SET domain-containing protein
MTEKIAPSHKVYLSSSTIPKAGRGVFAACDIQKGELIELCPVFVFPRKDYPLLKKTSLREYYFMWGKVTVGVCFGFGSMYNHSYQANATYKKKIKERVIEFVAIKNIKQNEEITVNYNYGNSNDKSELWIKSIHPYEE